VFNLTVEEPAIDMKHPSRESKAEPVPDPFMSPFIRNLSGPNSSDIHHGEGFSSNALDISKTKGYPSFHVCFVFAICLYEVKNSKHEKVIGISAKCKRM